MTETSEHHKQHTKFRYLSGFGAHQLDVKYSNPHTDSSLESATADCSSAPTCARNELQSEAIPGALPKKQNNPMHCPFSLYAEQLSGTAFTAPRRQNQRSWLYRVQPSVVHEPFKKAELDTKITADPSKCIATPSQLRWLPFPIWPATQSWLNTTRGHSAMLCNLHITGVRVQSEDVTQNVQSACMRTTLTVGVAEPVTFVEGLVTVCCSGSCASKDGYAIHIYTATEDMVDSCLCNTDGDFLIVPQQGALIITTEFGRMYLPPGEIAVVQRGIRFAVALDLSSETANGSASPEGARGYVLEVYNGHFVLPDLGPIGANGLANPRDFEMPTAWFENRKCDFTIIQKFLGEMFIAKQDHSAFDVAAWHGNYCPYKYNLELFCPMNSVGFDHADPSIFTVLTCPSATPGVAVADFVVFPSRWIVAEHTFRPPYFHRNNMNEFMGLICGVYEGKQQGFVPGGASLHMCMAPHGPDTKTFEDATDEHNSKVKTPQVIPPTTLAFMFEVNATPYVTPHALETPCRDSEYFQCWQGLKAQYNGPPPSADSPPPGA